MGEAVIQRPKHNTFRVVCVGVLGIISIFNYGCSKLSERNRSIDLEDYANSLVGQADFWERIDGIRYYPSDPSNFVDRCTEIQEGVFLIDKKFVYRAKDFDGNRFANDPSKHDDFFLIDLKAKQNAKFLGVTPGLGVYEISGNQKLTELIEVVGTISD